MAQRSFSPDRWEAMIRIVREVIEHKLSTPEGRGRVRITPWKVAVKVRHTKYFFGLEDNDLIGVIKDLLRSIEKRRTLPRQDQKAVCTSNAKPHPNTPDESVFVQSAQPLDLSTVPLEDLIRELARRIRATRSLNRGHEIIRELAYAIETRTCPRGTARGTNGSSAPRVFLDERHLVAFAD